MTVSTGANGVSATPATDEYNRLVTLMNANGNWTQSGLTNSSLSAGDAGTTATCQIWKNTFGTAFYVCFEIDDTNARLRIRVAENYEDGGAAAKKVRRWVDGHNNGVNITPTAQNTAVGGESDGTWGASTPTVGSTASVAYTEIKCAAGGYTYVEEVRDQLLTVATRSSSLNYYAIAGYFTSLVQSVGDTIPLMLAGHPTNPGQNGQSASTSIMKGISTSRSPGITTASVGGFSYLAIPLFGGGSSTNSFGAVNGGATPTYFANPMSAPAILHGIGNTGTLDNSNPRTFRGTLDDFRCCQYQTESVVGDTLTIGGVTYYVLGASSDGSGSGLPGAQKLLLAVKG